MTSSMLTNLRSLLELSHKHGVDMKPTLLRVLTDLYMQKPAHTRDEEAQFSELFCQLFDAADAETRSTIAFKLSAHPAVPADVMRLLAPQRTEAAPPARPANPTQRLEQRSPVRPIADRPIADRPIHDRSDDVGATFFAADAAERHLILANLRYSDAVTVQRMPPMDTTGAVNELETAALAGKPGEFIRTLERALGLSRSVAQRIVNDPSGEPIIVAAKALAMPLAVLQRILLFVNPAVGHSVRRVYELSALYEDIRPDVARHLVALWRRPDAPPTTRHQPFYWDGETRGARDVTPRPLAARPQVTTERKDGLTKRR